MERYPPIGEYALLSDCHAAALVSTAGSIDWCCLPRFDDGSTFGRLLDWHRGGHCTIAPTSGEVADFREYVDGTLVLDSTFRVEGGDARLLDCLLMPPQPDRGSARRLLRVIEGRRGAVELTIRVAPRFDYGEIRPWLRHHGLEQVAELAQVLLGVIHRALEEKVPGPEGVVRVNDRFLAALTDIDVTIEDQIAEGDKVVTRWSAEGTHSGEFMGIPATGRRVRATGIEIHLIRDERIAAEWGESDELGLLTQLGAVELRRGA